MKKLVALVFVLTAAALLGAAGAATWIYRYMHQPVDLDQARTFYVEPGNGLRQVSRKLYEQHIVTEPEFFNWYGRFLGRAADLRAGEYMIGPGMTPAEILELLVSGAVVMHSITVAEGLTFQQMHGLIREHPAVRATTEASDPDQLMATLGAPGRHPEGQFFPDTYRFPRGIRDIEIFRQAFELMQSRLQQAWSQRLPDSVLGSPYEALILASIIEKETGLDSERRAIAGVFARRLQRGMRLQTDPTVIYGLGEAFDGNLRRRDLASDTPYNTYTRNGLPPTPIALPGEASLLAAVQPDDGEALYFVATGRGDGSHFFSNTLDEHNRAVRRYLDTLRSRRERSQ